jgi:hypothetical protein
MSIANWVFTTSSRLRFFVKDWFARNDRIHQDGDHDACMVKEVDAQEKRARQERKASGGGISSIAGGVGGRFFPLPPGRWVNM